MPLSAKSLSLSAILLCLPLLAHAEIYQWQDTEGNKHFSDRSHADAKILTVKPGYSYQSIKTVYDGDTVVLEDGRKIRLLGINTPEVRHRDKQADAGGDEAKQWLITRLKNTKVRVQTDVELTDKYKRTLGHLFTENKQHINLELVKAGLAEVSIYPPNLLFTEELLAAQQQAEHAKVGIWQRPEFAVLPVSSLTDEGHTGWTRLVGKVTTVRDTRKSIYLTFSDKFEARIERKWLALFPGINSYLGKNLEVRGWLNRNRGVFSMLIRHPSAIVVR
ncbi:thermonuclease family protein [Crenothrix polyspora]|uniref:Nuclease (SNase domain-containing protein) n=1 Tax=Crenothrix polyspora TaxID=360316 RepID=A0A1R4H9X4_9GAMM|nr:thermonuclease family protein [Crenothrix polyspora]SJM93062.1 Nuclease (SNase domain-containing protein) [Crenothrix polyspora]